jgi:hypothetical protein
MKLKPYSKTKFIIRGTLANNFLYKTKIKKYHHDRSGREACVFTPKTGSSTTEVSTTFTLHYKTGKSRKTQTSERNYE